MKHYKITFKPDGKEVLIHEGATLLEAAGQAGIVLDSVCGGQGTCGKCKVELQNTHEKVLACQYTIHNDITVFVPVQSKLFEHKILVEGVGSRPLFEPDIYKKYSSQSIGGRILGVAVDIGTTTIVTKLLDMITGKCLAFEAEINPQTSFGDDVVSRISYAQNEEKLNQLQQIVIDCVNKLIGRLCTKTATSTKDIFEVAVVGNTTMNHIFLGLPVKQLGQAPYNAYSVDAKDTPADKSGLKINSAGNIHAVENIAGFVGADTVGVALAVDIDSSDQMTLVVDIGTNGEVILGTKDKLYAASCAAGPALEGARIYNGSRAMDGAIEAVVIGNGDIDLDIIGMTKARSICGSGLIDVVAVLLNLGIIDSTGRFVNVNSKDIKNLPPAIFERISEKNSQPAFCLVYGDNKEPAVILTQKDIREVQLAKAAVRTGIKLLQKNLGIGDADIERVLMAGAFGNYIRKESALRIGIIPDIPAERIHFVGNAAESGAEMVLISSKAREMTKKISQEIEYIEIAREKDFTGVYAECMMF